MSKTESNGEWPPEETDLTEDQIVDMWNSGTPVNLIVADGILSSEAIVVTGRSDEDTQSDSSTAERITRTDAPEAQPA